MSRWVAGKRGAEGIEVDDLLAALIHKDQGSAWAEMFPGSMPNLELRKPWQARWA